MFWVSVGVGIGILIFGIDTYSRLAARLRSKHEATWVALGRPRVVGDADSQRLALSILSFLTTRKFLALNDPMVTSLGWRLLALNAALMVCVAIVIILGIREGVFK